jgi:SAM-dependent methyltransferase
VSEAWSDGYFTDVGYTYGYYREINPVYQRFCLLVRGFSSPQEGAGHHCELGFGQGVSVVVHAAANPGHYVATDFNPAQATHANTLAATFNSDARLYDDSFEQLLARTDLPQFDSISLHGIWTWVSRANQALIAEFARRHLKPGGVFYISYNCFPGWSPVYPLRQLFAAHDRFTSAGSVSVERVDAALKFSEALLAAQPNYLKVVPHLNDRLKTITGQNRNYLAHEYFNREWNCMYFTDVVDILAPAKLDYATSAVPLDALDAVNLSADGQAFLKTINHPILREQARDYFINQQFRKDLYVRGVIPLSPLEQRELLLDSRFVLVLPPDGVAPKVNGAAGEAALQQEIYQPIIAAMAAKNHAPKTLRQLASALPNIPYGSLQQAVTVLVGMGAAAPCQGEDAEKKVYARCAALNLALCKRAILSAEIEVLASPVTGGGITVGRFQKLFLLAIKGGKKAPAEWAQYVWQILAEQGQRIIREGRQMETAEENLAELERQASEFSDRHLMILRALHITL